MNKPQNFFFDRRTCILLLLSIIAVYGLSVYKRQASYSYWMENRQDYVVGHVTAMSDMDSYYWLKMARELDKGTLGKKKPDPTKGYPDLVPLAIKDSPSLLAELISFARNFTGGDYYRSGLILVTILAGLFVFPLFFYFNRLGFGASAVLGGLIGSFSHAYYARTAMGRVDTDLLNIFFPLLAACFILPMDREKTWIANVLLAAGAGFSMYLFTWWYQVPFFILVYLPALAVYLIFGRVPWKQTAAVLVIFLLASGPDYVQQSMQSLRTILGAYVSPLPTGGIAWPNILGKIAEAEKIGIVETLKRLHGLLPVVFAGFAGLAYLYVRRFRQMIPVTPLILLGAWSLTGPSRFAMYLAPFIGVGAGVLIEGLVGWGGKKAADRKGQSREALLSAASVALMFLLFFSTSGHTRYAQQTAPIVSASTTGALLDIKSRVPAHSAMFTPFWEFGYPLMEIGDFATYHDGGLHGGMRTTLTSKAMTSTRQEDMVSMLYFLEDYGFNHLSSLVRKENLSGSQMMERVFNYPGKFKGEDVYVLYLEETLRKVRPMSHFGTWDFELRTSDPMDYVKLDCFSPTGSTMRCSDGTIDLARGFMNDGSVDIPLRAILWVDDGYVADRTNFANDQGYYLQVLMKNGKLHMILVADERLFRTNFNQQYLLGNFDRRYFEEVYNNFPVARVLKLKKKGEQPSISTDRNN
jgi:dolichyl-diphosphooligosaccharide--protein glycosyltransferase